MTCRFSASKNDTNNYGISHIAARQRLDTEIGRKSVVVTVEAVWASDRCNTRTQTTMTPYVYSHKSLLVTNPYGDISASRKV